jgi:hypothetical protein
VLASSLPEQQRDRGDCVRTGHFAPLLLSSAIGRGRPPLYRDYFYAPIRGVKVEEHPPVTDATSKRHTFLVKTTEVATARIIRKASERGEKSFAIGLWNARYGLLQRLSKSEST